MTAVWYRARAELRRRWRGTVGLALLVGLAGGVVLAAVAGARRTATAMDRFLAYNRPADLEVQGEVDPEALVALPQVVAAHRAGYLVMAPPLPSGKGPDLARVGSVSPVVSIEGVNPKEGIERVSEDVQGFWTLVRYAPGADPGAALAHLQEDHGKTVVRPMTAAPVENLTRVQGLPNLLAGVLAGLGAGTLAHALASSVRRRRRDLAVLKTLGFVRGQLSLTVAWQATILVVLALAVALPLGLAAGRWAWRLVAGQIGTGAGAVTPVLAVVLVVPATLLLANLIAALPARAAGRTQPATTLRTE